MKRKIALAITLALSIVLVSLTSSDSRVAAQNQIRVVADTGVLTLGPNQILRTIIVGDVTGNAVPTFKKIGYTQGACGGGGICKLTAAAQNTSDPIILTAGESAFFDVPAEFPAVRAVVLSNSRDVRVNVMIIDAATGEVVTSYVLKDVLISS
jgi:hypothetical protein